MAKKVNGRERVWEIQELIGSGDAGEVLRVVSQPNFQQGVMKRPVQNVSGGTIVRQAGQIETEGKILTVLDGVDFTKNGLTIHTPRLLDRSIEGTTNTVNLFIVSEEVQGNSISSMLADRLTSGQSIPQNVVMKVLSSLMFLLEQAHSKGVVWNDVKMDHIFWNPQTNTMSFIDWGNGIFIQPQPDIESSPIWQDYSQLITEGLSLLEQTAPQLISDLDWPLQPSDLKPGDIPQLRMRLIYLESYLTMRAIEYELLFERFTKSMPDLKSLTLTLELNQDLRQFGITTDLTCLLSAAQVLLLKILAENDLPQAVRVFDLIEHSLKEQFPSEWRLAGYLLKLTEPIPPKALIDLLQKVYAKDWVEASWHARGLIDNGFTARELGPAIVAMRNLSFDSSISSTIYADLRSFDSLLSDQLAYLQSNSSSSSLAQSLALLQGRLQAIITNWTVLKPNEPLGNQLFNLRQVIRDATSLRLKLPDNLSELLQKALTTARDVYQAWNTGDLDGSLKAIKRLYFIEPTLDYLLTLEDHLKAAKTNLEQFEVGPSPDQSVNSFAAELLSQPDHLHNHLGKPDWLAHYSHALQTMSKAINLENLQDTARQQGWPTPWLFQPGIKLDLPYDQIAQGKLNEQQTTLLRKFHQQLRSSQSTAAELVVLRQLLPASYGAYKDLQEEFDFAFSSIPLEPFNPDLKNFPAQDADAVSQALKILSEISTWKSAAEIGEWTEVKSTATQLDPSWKLTKDLQNTTILWTSEVLPALTEIRQLKWKSTSYKKLLQPKLPSLLEARARLYTFICEWQKIEYQGLYPELLKELVYQCDAAQNAFFTAWQQVLRSDSREVAWLAQNEQGIFSEINQNLLALLRSIRAMQRNFEVINQPEMARTRLARNAAGDLMFLLNKVDENINPTNKPSPVFKRWQKQYLDLLSVADSDKIRRDIREIEGLHPLLPWFDELVRRDAGYFEPPTA